MIKAYNKVGGSMASVKEVPQDQTSSYGILSIGRRRGNLLNVKGMIEKPALGEEPSNLAVVARYILTSNIFEYIEKQRFCCVIAIQLTDAISNEVSLGRLVNGFRFQGQRFDCGTKAGFIQAIIYFALSRDDLREDLNTYLNEIVSVAKQAQSLTTRLRWQIFALEWY